MAKKQRTIQAWIVGIIALKILLLTIFLSSFLRNTEPSGLVVLEETIVREVTLNKEVVHSLNTLWNQTHTTNEFIVCLEGTYSTNTQNIHVSGLRGTIVYEATLHNITSRDCGSSGIVGSLHSHPSGNCALSEQDIETFSQVHSIYRTTLLMGIMCDYNTLSLYTIQEPTRKIKTRTI